MIIHMNSNIAVHSGVDVALFIHQLSQWTFLNLANKNHIYDGHAWSYNTLEAYEAIFPFWTKRQLERIINKAIADGLVLKENYNKNRYDRTCWYAMTGKAMAFYPELLTQKNLKTLYLSISPNGEMNFTEWRNVFLQTVTPIPTDNTTSNISNDILQAEDELEDEPKPKPKKKGPFGINELLADNPHQIEQPVLEDWLEVRKAKRNKVTFTAWKNINESLKEINEKLGITPHKAFETMVTRGWQSLEVDYFMKEQPKTKKTIDDFPNYI